MLKKSFKIIIFAVAIGIFSGFLCGLFAKLLLLATDTRRIYFYWPYLLLPFVGAIVTGVYLRYGAKELRGSNLILDEIHHPQSKIRLRMVPMIFISSILSHLFGASVGREGVGVQIGAGIADQFPHKLIDRKLLLSMGISAGFSAMFGAPFAAAVFGIEIQEIGRFKFRNLIPCLIASLVGFFTSKIVNGRQGLQMNIVIPPLNFKFFYMTIIIGICFGLTANVFSFLIHHSKSVFGKIIQNQVLQTFIGGIILASVYFSTNSDRYLGLGEELLSSAFATNLPITDSVGKMFTTIISIGSGFKGGEVMPLFIIGSTMGSFLSNYIIISKTLVSALGLIAVFAGASNTPMASIILSIEFFGIEILPYSIIAILVSFLFSGNLGIYSSQKRRFKKFICLK